MKSLRLFLLFVVASVVASAPVLSQPQLAVKQQRFVIRDDGVALQQFLLSQPRLSDYSIALISTQPAALARTIEQLREWGVSDDRIQVRHDLRKRLKQDEQQALVALVEWFQPQGLNCQSSIGCANRSNLLQMLAQPRHLYSGDKSAAGVHGREAIQALEYQRNHRDLPGDRRTSLTMEGR
ncbi:hypothetical protein CHH28_09145 [Bacterioplanes sanyensis]|uniref:Uncharacterized protein n=1 Tax=Bacterioplanes sanyensis TaxID=1249553 RepID=A0A222FIH0_9GAMM|nr:hypothetical protein [Bacterioplanes sanyensis]ASP38835.1 hypothetical protein CHH28_09145 [Bacterioplanes sanyensis]